jgi:hypothetical protein
MPCQIQTLDVMISCQALYHCAAAVSLPKDMTKCYAECCIFIVMLSVIRLTINYEISLT